MDETDVKNLLKHSKVNNVYVLKNCPWNLIDWGRK